MITATPVSGYLAWYRPARAAALRCRHRLDVLLAAATAARARVYRIEATRIGGARP